MRQFLVDRLLEAYSDCLCLIETYFRQLLECAGTFDAVR